VSVGELTALVRRHAVAVSMVLILAAATAYSFKHTQPTYQESATVVLAAASQPYGTFGKSLVTTGEVVADWIMGPQGRQQVGPDATDGFDVALVNFNNQEYPFYAVPYLTVSASAQDPATAHRTFTTVIQTIDEYLQAHQRQAGVARDLRVTTTVIGDTGPLIQPGSRIRSFAGLAMLTVVAAYLVSSFLDRHPIRPVGPLRFQRRDTRYLTSRRSFRRPARPGA
jgi:hypothetical protein